MNLVSLLVLPSIISTQDQDGKRLLIAAAAFVVLGASVIRSSRQKSTILASAQ
jgi:hypothetical protein